MLVKVILIVFSFAQLCASQQDSDIHYNLFTQKNKANLQRLVQGNPVSVLNSHFNATKPTKIVVHGGWRGGFAGWNLRLKDALLSKEDVNVIVVHWGKLAVTDYAIAVKNTRFVGKSIARLIELLESRTGTTRKMVHLIGHSLGGQIVGFAGQSLNPRPAKVTGLDTAENLYNHLDKSGYLDPTDAEFVEEIYGRVSNNKFLKGHANFFPNGGNDVHMIIPEYYISSVYGGRCSFAAYTCPSYADLTGAGCRSTDGNHMGYYSTKPTSRQSTSYYLYANKDKPCLGFLRSGANWEKLGLNKY